MLKKKTNFSSTIFLIISSILFFSEFNQLYAKTKNIGNSRDWSAYISKIDKKKTCFIASEPKKSIGNYKKENRDKTYVFVTNIKGSTVHEVSVIAGFKYKENSEVIFNIDGKKTKMFPVEDRAWSESSKIDKILVRLMKRGKKLTVIGTSSPGNLIKDEFSLSGFTKTLKMIDKSCS